MKMWSWIAGRLLLDIAYDPVLDIGGPSIPILGIALIVGVLVAAAAVTIVILVTRKKKK